MLIQGASIVRFANSFVDAYSTGGTFVLVVVFIRAEGLIDRFLLFQSQLPDRKVCIPALHVKLVDPVC